MANVRQKSINTHIQELNSYIHGNEIDKVKNKLSDNYHLLVQQAKVNDATQQHAVTPLTLAFILGKVELCQLLMQQHNNLYSLFSASNLDKFQKEFGIEYNKFKESKEKFLQADQMLVDAETSTFGFFSSAALGAFAGSYTNLVTGTNPRLKIRIAILLDVYAGLIKDDGIGTEKEKQEQINRVNKLKEITLKYLEMNTTHKSPTLLFGAAVALAQLEQEFPHGLGANPIQDAQKVFSDAASSQTLNALIDFRLNLKNQFEPAVVTAYRNAFAAEMARLNTTKRSLPAVPAAGGARPLPQPGSVANHGATVFHQPQQGGANRPAVNATQARSQTTFGH